MNIFQDGLRAMILLIAAQFLSATATAAIVTVGSDGGCQFGDLQSAVNAAKSGDDIHIAGAALPDVHVQMHGVSLTVIGGYGKCTDATDSQTYTFTSLYGDSASVLLIDGNTHLILRRLALTGAELSAQDSHGGGLNFIGHGVLTLDHVGISFNKAGYGGGMNISADDETTVNINESTAIEFNTAYREGGGINIEGAVSMFMLQPEIYIYNNKALDGTDWGAGGGMQIVAPAHVEIGASSSSTLGVVGYNTARNGGGIALRGGGLHLVSLDANKPVTLIGNTASQKGGAIYADEANHSGGFACGMFFNIVHNTSADGAAIYGTPGGYAPNGGGYCNSGRHNDDDPGLTCPVGVPCTTISDNLALGEDGAIIYQNIDSLGLDFVEMRGNTAAHAIKVTNNNSATIYDTLIADNTLSKNIIELTNATNLYMRSCTIAGNHLPAGSPAISTTSPAAIRQSILWQPLGPLLHLDETAVSGNDLVVSDGASFDKIANLKVVSDPGFIDVLHGDYHLRSTSPAINMIPSSINTSPTDLEGRPRGVSLSNTKSPTPVDAGAYERQFIPSQTFPFFAETFNELDPSGLEMPTGWTATTPGAEPGWIVSTRGDSNDDGVTPNFAAHVDDPGYPSESSLTSPSFNVSSSRQGVTFRHTFQLEAGYDVAILQISINGGPFTDIGDAGGSFITGGYNTVMLPGNPPNPIDRVGKQVWSGDSGSNPYRTVAVRLPQAALGHSVQLRWLTGSDGSGTHAGYWLDNINVSTDFIFSDDFERY
jgi:predicted outer membrane repeat protein